MCPWTFAVKMGLYNAICMSKCSNFLVAMVALFWLKTRLGDSQGVYLKLVDGWQSDPGFINGVLTPLRHHTVGFPSLI